MTGSNTNNKFKAARENKDFVQDVNSDATEPKYTIEFTYLDEEQYVAMCKLIGSMLGFSHQQINDHVFTEEELCDCVMELENELQAAQDEAAKGAPKHDIF